MRTPPKSGSLTLVALAACVLALVYRPLSAVDNVAHERRSEPEVRLAPEVPPVPEASPAPGDTARKAAPHPYLHETITTTSDGRTVVSNPAAIDVVVNKERALPDGYAPADLVFPKVPFSFDERIEKRMLRRDAAEALEDLFAAAARDGVRLVGISGYRSYATQRTIFARQVRTKGETEAARVSARPGTSEHQTGLAIDVSSASVDYALSAGFGRSREGRWLSANAHRFGFIIRYPEGREAVTGYIYEPWHIRYVGTELAGQIAASGTTMDEYFAAPVPAERIVEGDRPAATFGR
jgi:D-alanyl-D-alanine carboxypeptidase